MLSGMELKLQRVMKGIKASQIAELLGVSNAFVTYMEKGERKIPQDKYIQWVNYLEVK